MKKSLKRVLSVLLAAAMLLGMSVTSFAAGSSETEESQPSQPILRGPAKPITSITLEKGTWNKTEKCYEFIIREQGIGPDTVKFGNTRLWATKRDPLYEGANRTEVVGWRIYYKSPRIYSAGTYTLDATFVSTNGGPQKVWTLKKDYTVTQEMLQ